MFINDLKFLVRFSSSSMFEEVSQTNLVPIGDNITPSISTGGYLMQNDQYLLGDGIGSNGYNLSVTDEYALGFWLYSASPGLVIDSLSGVLVSIEMPVLNFVDVSSAEHTIIEITEHTQTSGNNSLKLSERGGYSVFTEEYLPNKWHYFWVSRITGHLRIFVDGSEQTLQDETGSRSSNLMEGLGSLLNLYVNHSLDGYSTSVAKNTGIIDDIFFLNVRNSSQTDIQRSINDGVLYVVDDIFTGTNIVKSDIYMNDPETITINSMIDDLSYIFIGRNDGKIMRGSSLFWETRRSFSDSAEFSGFDFSGSSSGQTGGFLRLINDTIRL
jgi:hypothetical protein